METEIDKVHFTYQRIPISWDDKTPKKGRPSQRLLFLYVRGVGFGFTTKQPPRSKGGRVICTITTKDDSQYSGEAHCSCSENFCYKRGRDISLGRAKKLMEVSTD